jgi:hypothetical protein
MSFLLHFFIDIYQRELRKFKLTIMRPIGFARQGRERAGAQCIERQRAILCYLTLFL